MAEPVFAVDEVRYRPDEPRERVFMGVSMEEIENYRPIETHDPEATFTELRELRLPWYEIFARICNTHSDARQDWHVSLDEYFDEGKPDSSYNAVVLYIGKVGAQRIFPEVDTPKLF